MLSVRQLLDSENTQYTHTHTHIIHMYNLSDAALSDGARKVVFEFCIDQLNSDSLTNHVSTAQHSVDIVCS